MKSKLLAAVALGMFLTQLQRRASRRSCEHLRQVRELERVLALNRLRVVAAARTGAVVMTAAAEALHEIQGHRSKELPCGTLHLRLWISEV